MTDATILSQGIGMSSETTTLSEPGTPSSKVVPVVTIETVIEALHRLPPEYLPHILQYIEFLEYKMTYTPDDSSEDEALWDAVQAERTYRQKHPEDIIVCETVEELREILENEE